MSGVVKNVANQKTRPEDEAVNRVHDGDEPVQGEVADEDDEGSEGWREH